MAILFTVEQTEAEKVFSQFVANSSKVYLADKTRGYLFEEIDTKHRNAAELFRLYKDKYNRATFYTEEKILRIISCLKKVGEMEKVNGGYSTQIDEIDETTKKIMAESSCGRELMASS